MGPRSSRGRAALRPGAAGESPIRGDSPSQPPIRTLAASGLHRPPGSRYSELMWKPSHLALLSAVVVLLLAACRSSDGDEPAELGACCEASLALVSEMPECCQSGTSTAGAFTGCCAEGMQPDKPDADRPDCCRASMQLVREFSPCCQKTLMTGDPDGCCEGMPAALRNR